MKDITLTVANFIKQKLLNLPEQQDISGEVNLLELGLDSLAIIRLVDFIENEFEIDLSEANVTPSKVKTLNLIENLIREKSNIL